MWLNEVQNCILIANVYINIINSGIQVKPSKLPRDLPCILTIRDGKISDGNKTLKSKSKTSGCLSETSTGATTVGTGGRLVPQLLGWGTNNVLVPQLLGRTFQKARNFAACSHQNAGFSIWVFKNFYGGDTPRPSQREGLIHSYTQHPAWPLAGHRAQMPRCWDPNLGPPQLFSRGCTPGDETELWWTPTVEHELVKWVANFRDWDVQFCVRDLDISRSSGDRDRTGIDRDSQDPDFMSANHNPSCHCFDLVFLSHLSLLVCLVKCGREPQLIWLPVLSHDVVQLLLLNVVASLYWTLLSN